MWNPILCTMFAIFRFRIEHLWLFSFVSDQRRNMNNRSHRCTKQRYDEAPCKVIYWNLCESNPTLYVHRVLPEKKFAGATCASGTFVNCCILCSLYETSMNLRKRNFCNKTERTINTIISCINRFYGCCSTDHMKYE